MNEYYFAPVYDVLLHPFIHKLRKRVAQLAKHYQAKSVIDMCCGTGHQIKYLNSANIDATGVDLNDMMLQQASKSSEKTQCKKGDASQTEYPDSRFDMAMTTLSLHEMPADTARSVIKEMIRITKPSGFLMLIDYDFTDRSSKLMKTALKAIEYFVGGDHYRNFRKYLASGQMEFLTGDLNLEITETHYFFGKTVALRIFKKI